VRAVERACWSVAVVELAAEEFEEKGGRVSCAEL
jgi:hypothetical protein